MYIYLFAGCELILFSFVFYTYVSVDDMKMGLLHFTIRVSVKKISNFDLKFDFWW